MRLFLFFFLFLLISGPMLAQQKFKPTISAYVMYGRHFQTSYIVDSGSHNLKGRKMYRSYEAGMNLDFIIGKNWGFRTGIYGHLHRVGEWFYGVSGVAPSFIESEQHRQNMKEYACGATEYIERSTIGIPLVPTYTCPVNDKISLLFSGGPVVSIYFPVREELVRNTTEVTPSVGDPYWVRKFEIERSFNQSKIIKGIGVSKPLVEWDFNVEGAYRLKNYGAIKLGVKTHLATTNLERANFVIWPYHAEYRAKDHYTLNRSYIGVYTGFVFVRHGKDVSNPNKFNP